MDEKIGAKIAAHLAAKFYLSLPQSVRAFMSREDLTSIGILQLVRKHALYDPARCQYSTFAYTVVVNCYRDTLKLYRMGKPSSPGVTVALEDVHPSKISMHPSTELQLDARRRVQAFLLTLSTDCREIIESYYFGGEDYARLPKATLRRLRAQVASARKRSSVSADDFRCLQATPV